MPNMLLSAMCVTTYLKAMLTDGYLLSVSSRAANYAPHKTIMLHGELSATSPAHHRMAINHLLHRLIYDVLLSTRCHTEGKVWLLLKELWTLLSALEQLFIGCKIRFCSVGFPLYLYLKVWASRSRTYGDALSFRVNDFSLLALYIEMDWLVGLPNILGAVR